MGRGLSDLQKTMLRMSVDSDDGWVYFRHVFMDVYGWVPEKIRFGKPMFSKERWPEAYMAAYVAVTKSAARLERRGLVHVVLRNGKAYRATDAGRAVVSPKLRADHD